MVELRLAQALDNVLDIFRQELLLTREVPLMISPWHSWRVEPPRPRKGHPAQAIIFPLSPQGPWASPRLCAGGIRQRLSIFILPSLFGDKSADDGQHGGREEHAE